MTESPHEFDERCKPRKPSLCKSYAFGDNSFVQLGVGDCLDRHLPVRSAYTEKFNVIDVAVGAYHTMILLDNHDVYGWGGNNMGELGLGHTTKEVEPKRVDSLTGKRIRFLYAANYHSFALCTNGDIYAFGENENYELGLGDNDNRQSPQRIDALAGQQIDEICTAEMHSFGITTDRRVYGWGNNYNGELGLGDVAERNLPEEVLAFRDIPLCKIRCGGSFSVALSLKGVVYTWGINCYGQLGLADVVNRSTPEVIRSLNGTKIIDIAVGSAQSICLSEDGTVYVWGYNGRGELGLGDQTDRMIPTVLLEGYSDSRLFGYPCSRHFFIYRKGRVIVWGVNSNGQLGVGDTRDRDRPEELVALRDQFKQYEEVHFVIGYCSTFVLFSIDQSLAVMMYSIWKRNLLADLDIVFNDDSEPARKKRKQ